jgi:hypothetical protein
MQKKNDHQKENDTRITTAREDQIILFLKLSIEKPYYQKGHEQGHEHEVYLLCDRKDAQDELTNL